MSQFFCENIVAFYINFVQNHDIWSNFQQPLLHFSQLNYDNGEILWHTIWISNNFEIEIVTIVKYLKSSQRHLERLWHLQRLDFLNAIDELIFAQWNYLHYANRKGKDLRENSWIMQWLV